LFASAFLSATLLPGSSEAALIALLALGRSVRTGCFEGVTSGEASPDFAALHPGYSLEEWSERTVAAEPPKKLRVPLTKGRLMGVTVIPTG
jgi:hypothetical protein